MPHYPDHAPFPRPARRTGQIPIRDVKGLIITPEKSFAEAPPLDLLVVPGGFGQEELMDDDVVLQFIREQVEGARYVFSVCAGALLCGAAVCCGVYEPPHLGPLFTY